MLKELIKSFVRFFFSFLLFIGFLWGICTLFDIWFGKVGATIGACFALGVAFALLSIHVKMQEEYRNSSIIQKIKKKPKKIKRTWKEGRPKIIKLNEWKKKK